MDTRSSSPTSARGARARHRSTPVFADVVGLVPGEPTAPARTWRNDGKAQRVIVQQGTGQRRGRSSASRRSTTARSTRTVARLERGRLRRRPTAMRPSARSQRLVRTTAPWGVDGRDRPRPRRRGRPRSRRRWCRAASSPRASASVTSCSPRTAFDESHRFLTDGLGLGQSDWLEMELAPGIELEVRFYHCNARHHTLALARAPFELPQTLHHVMFETNDARRRRRRVRPGVGDRPRHPERARSSRQRRHVQLLRADARPASRSRSATAPRSSPTTGTTTAATTASARGATSRCGRHERESTRRRSTPTSRSSATDRSATRWRSCSPSSAAGRRARAVARAVPAAAGGALRPRGRSHPPVVRHRRRAAGDQRAGRGLRVAQRRRHDAAALRPDRRRPVGLAGVVDVQPAELEALLDAPGRALLGVDVRRGVEVTGVEQRDDHVVVTGADGTIAVGALRRRVRRRQQHGARRCSTSPVDRPRVLLRLAHRRRDPRRAARVRSDQPADLRPGAADDRGVGRARAGGAGSSCACPHESLDELQRRGAGVGAARAVGRAPRQRPPRTPRRLHVQRPLRRASGGPGGCSSPATPPT